MLRHSCVYRQHECLFKLLALATCVYDALATRMATQRSSTERGSSLRTDEHLKGLNGNLMIEFGDNSSQSVKGTLMGQWVNIDNFSKTIFLLHQPGWTQVSKACLTCGYEGQMLQTLFFQIPFNQDSLSQCLLTLRGFHGNLKNTLVYLHPGGSGKSFTSSCEFHFGKEVI